MQQIQYFKSAWGDIKNSPNWFGKLCLLALINFIPIFGQIVTLGYLYGWAREIAWGTHEPMPAKIFGNEDGKLYRRGWFIFVLAFVAALIPWVVMQIGSGLSGTGLWGVAADKHAAANSILTGIGLLIYLVGLAGSLLVNILAWIGSMRISIYDRLSAGFQVGKIWKMFRHDTGGAMRIFGMYLLVGLIIGIILSIVLTILMFLVFFVGVAGLAANGYNVAMLQHMSDAQSMVVFAQIMSSAGVVGFFGILLFVFLAYLAQVFIMLLVARAIGYWTLQFDVPRWRGQDDPMPFEAGIPFAGATPVNPAAAAPDNQAPYNQAPYSQAPYNPAGQPMQPGVVQQPPYFAGQPTQPGTAQQPPYPYAQPTEPVVNQPYGSSLQSIPPTQQPMQDMTGTAPSYAQPEPVQTAPVQASTQPLVDDVAASADQAASDAPVAPPMAEDGGADRGLQEE